jgi:hypothetical protein
MVKFPVGVEPNPGAPFVRFWHRRDSAEIMTAIASTDRSLRAPVMNSGHYLWLTESLLLLTFFLVQPILVLVIAWKAWRERPENLRRYRIPCLASGSAAVLLIIFAKCLNAHVGVAYLVQVACLVLGVALFGASMGCGFAVLLDLWRWHKNTRLS